MIRQNHSFARAASNVQRHSFSQLNVIQKAALLPLAAAAIAACCFAGTSKADPGKAGSAGLSGSWSGGGWVMFSTGNREKASCRASYRQQGGDSYTVQATCATSSGKASQTATVYKVSANRYRGSFYNSDYNVRGTIRVAVNGSSQSIDLSGEGASASLSLRKR